MPNDLIARVHASGNTEEAAALALYGVLDAIAAKMQHAPSAVMGEIDNHRAMVPALARAINTEPADPVKFETVVSGPVAEAAPVELPKAAEPEVEKPVEPAPESEKTEAHVD